MKKKNLFILSMMLFTTGGFLCCGVDTHKNKVQGETMMEQKFQRTIITPHLQQEFMDGKNLLWCATLQFAWNELLLLAEGDFHMKNESPLVPLLNQQMVVKADVDEDSYIAKAGFVGKGILQDIQKEQQKKFNQQSNFSKEFGSLPKDSLVAYAYLLKTLPFQWSFIRLNRPFKYASQDVAAFGITQYASQNVADQRMGSQVRIIDYRDKNDFILELKTRSESDHLLLAKIAPTQTLSIMVQNVLERIKTATSTELREKETLVIPVVDFDAIQNYPELCGRKLTAKNPAVNGRQFGLVTQRIRFKLDETGAMLESKTSFVSAMPPRQFVFDRPFLILLIRENAQAPYFALWLENAELLVPFK